MSENTTVDDRLAIADIDWRGVSAKYIVVDIVGYVMSAVMVLGAASIAAWFSGQPLVWMAASVIAVMFLITIVLTPRRVRSIGYALRQDDLLFRRGILFQRFVSVPYGRMQLVDINRGPLARWLGLSELKFVTAAAATGVTIPGLPEADAEELRDRLVALAESRRAGL